MTTPTAAHRDVRTRMRTLLEDHDLPAPDAVLDDADAVVVLFEAPRVAVIVDLESGPPSGAALAERFATGEARAP